MNANIPCHTARRRTILLGIVLVLTASGPVLAADIDE